MKKTKFLALFLALLLTFSILPISVSAAVTDATPISNAEEFMNMTEGGSYYLIGDIDFSNETFDTPYVKSAFHGVLDGNGYTITGLSALNCNISSTSNVNIGLFGQLGGGNYTTVITNLNIGTATEPERITITVSEGVTAGQVDFGFLAGAMGGGNPVLINNVKIYGEVTVSSIEHTGHIAIGGFMGDSYHADITDSTFTGKIDVTSNTADKAKYIGGFVGLQRWRNNGTNILNRTVFNACTNNATISLKGTKSEGDTGVGGIVGLAKSTIALMNCANKGAVSSVEENTGGIIGCPYASNGAILALISDCTNTGTVTGLEGTNGSIYGTKKIAGTNLLRLCVMNCSAQNTPEYASGTTYESVYDYVMPINAVADFSKIGTDAAYPTDGFYVVKENLDFGGTSRNSCVVDTFNGVLNGNGKTITGLSFTGNEKAFFKIVSSTADAAILNLTLGDITSPVTISGATKYTGGALINKAGHTGSANTLFGTFVNNVDVYVDIDQAGGNAQLGGLAGLANTIVCIDCNVYGELDSTNENNTTSIGGFVGQINNISQNTQKSYFIDCNNFADVTTTSASTNTYRTGGFVGYNEGQSSVILDSNNFGDITHNSNNTTGIKSQVGAFSAYVHLRNVVNNCVNFGTVSGNNCGLAVGIAQAHNSCRVTAIGLKNYGTVTAEATGDVYTGATTANTIVYAGDNSTKVLEAPTMIEGASVRITSSKESTGLRFKAQIPEATLTELKDTFGVNNVSYGTIIAPTAFISAAGELTVDKLDAITTEENGFTGDTKAYVDVPATKWFVGSNGEETGVIAGSVTNLGNLCNTEFVGRAYIRITVGDNTTYDIYADYYNNNISNNTRTAKLVTERALDDVLYRTGTAQTGYSYFEPDGNGGYKAYTGNKDVAKYTNVVDSVTHNNVTYEKVSLYTSEQYGQLEDLLSAMQ